MDQRPDEPNLLDGEKRRLLRIREDQLMQPPPNGFARRDVEPVLTQQELTVLSGSWPGKAMIRSTVVLQDASLIALHIVCYPRVGFTELWRYYVPQEGMWSQRSWQQLPIAERLRVLEAYEHHAPAFALHPGNVPGHPELRRVLKQGSTYVLVALEERGPVSLVNKNLVYTLEQPLRALHAGYRSSPDREILLIKWHQGTVPTTWVTGPFRAAVLECSVSGRVRLSAGFVESQQLYPLRLVEQFMTSLPGK